MLHMCKNTSLDMLGEVRSSAVDIPKTGGFFGLNTPILRDFKCIPILKQVTFLLILYAVMDAQ